MIVANWLIATFALLPVISPQLAPVDMSITTSQDVKVSGLDSAGNFYLYGRYSGGQNHQIYSANGSSISFTPNQGGLVDSYMAKYDTRGLLQWVVYANGADRDDYIHGFHIDAQDNLMVVYWAQSNNFTVFKVDQTRSRSFPKIGASQSVVCKFGSNGTLLRSARFDGNRTWNVADYSAMGPNGYFLVHLWNSYGGYPNNPLLLYNDGNQLQASSNGGGHYFMMDNNLNYMYHLSEYTFAYEVIVNIDSNGWLYFLETAYGNVSIYDTSGRAIRAPSTTGSECPLLVFNQTGHFQYYLRFSGHGNEIAVGIAFDSQNQGYFSMKSDNQFKVYNASNVAVLTVGQNNTNGSYIFKLSGGSSILQWYSITGGSSNEIQLLLDNQGAKYLVGVTDAQLITYSSLTNSSLSFSRPVASQYGIIMMLSQSDYVLGVTYIYSNGSAVDLASGVVIARGSMHITYQSQSNSIDIANMNGLKQTFLGGCRFIKIGNLTQLVEPQYNQTTTSTTQSLSVASTIFAASSSSSILVTTSISTSVPSPSSSSFSSTLTTNTSLIVTSTSTVRSTLSSSSSTSLTVTSTQTISFTMSSINSASLILTSTPTVRSTLSSSSISISRSSSSTYPTVITSTGTMSIPDATIQSTPVLSSVLTSSDILSTSSSIASIQSPLQSVQELSTLIQSSASVKSISSSVPSSEQLTKVSGTVTWTLLQFNAPSGGNNGKSYQTTDDQGDNRDRSGAANNLNQNAINLTSIISILAGVFSLIIFSVGIAMWLRVRSRKRRRMQQATKSMTQVGGTTVLNNTIPLYMSSINATVGLTQLPPNQQ
ncbi:hypothetical protein MIR68_002602 [Amoeboaphelidium protococcarum]|nr:hypothetical protein MIR68_002602 [Amoeboaphelidium protococcarum]